MMAAKTSLLNLRTFATASETTAITAVVTVLFFTIAFGVAGWAFAIPALSLSFLAIGLGLVSLLHRRERGQWIHAVTGLTLGILLPVFSVLILLHPAPQG